MDATNYASHHNAIGELWRLCKEQSEEIERLKRLHPSEHDTPEVINSRGKEWVRIDVVKQREAKVAMLEAALLAAEDTRDMRAEESKRYFEEYRIQNAEIARCHKEIDRLKRLNATYIVDHGRAQDQLQAEIERLRDLLKEAIQDPERVTFYDGTREGDSSYQRVDESR